MAQPTVFLFNDALRTKPKLFGAKAANLLYLRQHGFAVPDSFFISSDAYQDHLQQCRLCPNDTMTDLVGIRAIIIGTPLDSALAAQVHSCYQQLAKSRLAVRSSASAEDLLGHSFAGQYESYLDVTSLADCLTAIKKCWASLWTERACSYRRKNGIASHAIRMAVIVQELIPADCAGVIFTADPINGDGDRCVLEACEGLGNALVSGEATPDRFVFHRPTMKLLQTVYAPGRSKPSLQKDDAYRLAQAAEKIEALFGTPQDIEWAMQNGEIFWLQTRPITTKQKEKTWEDRQIWSNMNTGEVAPDVATPMTWSFFRLMFKPLFNSVYHICGADLGDHAMAGLVAGRIYFNVNTIIALTNHFPLFIRKKMTLDHLLGSKLREEFLEGRWRFTKEDLPNVRGSLWKCFFRIPDTLYKMIIYRPARGRKFLQQTKAYNDQLQTQNLPAMSVEQLAEAIGYVVKVTMQKTDLAFILFSLGSYPLFRFLCQKWLGDQQGSIAHQLIRGQRGIEDVEAGIDLWNLAESAARTESVKIGIQTGESWQDCREKLDATEAGRAFVKQWQAFMARHGHHCRGELELYNARWEETPDYILRLVKNYMAGMEKIDFIKQQQKLDEAQTQTIQQCREILGNPWKKALFNTLIRRIQDGLQLRENWKNEIVRLVAQLRRMLRELGMKLHQRGLIEQSDDIFFLELEELKPAVHSARAAEFREKIRQRKQTYEANQKITPPPLVIGPYKAENNVQPQAAPAADTFYGLSVCPGQAIGKARVILRTDDKQQVLAGEILIAPFTDPAWTPYFLTAAGIVMDQGGLLSHGSIVAREYGIPTVVNVGSASKGIQTGQWIEVDADEGMVQILANHDDCK